MHVYFISNLKKTRKANKLDIKASGYCMLPPSLHPDGKTIYRWLKEPNGQLPELSLNDLGIEDFTEESKEPDDSDDIEDSEAIKKSCIAFDSSVSSVSSVNNDIVIFENLNDNTKNYVNKAIQSTLPNKSGYRNFLVFQFCRWLKGYPEFEQCQTYQLKPLVKFWHDKALQFIGTKIFDETWADFAYSWTRVKYPKGDGMLKIATDKALNAQNRLNAEEMYEKPEIKLLVRICFELQILRKPDSFWLSWNDAALILGVSKPVAGKWFSVLEADCIIKKLEEHTAIKAARYIFIAN